MEDTSTNFARINARISQSTKEFLLSYMNDHKCRSQGEALDDLVAQVQNQETNLFVADLVAEQTAARVIDSLKKSYLDPMRIRTGYVDKQTKALLEVMNHIILKGEFDQENVITTDVLEANVLTTAQDKVQKDIEHFRQRKASLEEKRKASNEL
ncbi:hypothetical protein [Enterococcus casseliflavus]|uniref:hypothetical protein n=1 Tax=Enterococcus casseliflavus TaxID=37734 RepID=UPI001C6FDF06|nr:hypothetical protein [Enterococcus casseliflavus]MBW9324033.1 hypothetical protein [Enterococcus casseliflavus]MDB1689727.1 hypothetical protein [Enterococcus casseliflavus]MEB6087905.1 hypothetical protein [Enterococcus casseliflavus]